MSRKVKSVRVPEEFTSLDLSGIIRECEAYLRDLESATLLKAQGNKAAAEALIKTRQADLGRKVAHKVWEARVEFGKSKAQPVESPAPEEAPAESSASHAPEFGATETPGAAPDQEAESPEAGE